MQNAAQQIEPSARLWFGKGLFVYSLAYLLAFAGIGFAVASIFEFGTNDSWKDPSLQTILTPIDFMISWIYFLLLRDSLEGYSSPAESYTRLLCLCYTLASRTVCLAYHSDVILFRLPRALAYAASASSTSRTLSSTPRQKQGLKRRTAAARGMRPASGVESGILEVDAPDAGGDEGGSGTPGILEPPPPGITYESFQRPGRPLFPTFPPDAAYAEYPPDPTSLRMGPEGHLRVGAASPFSNEQLVRMALYNVRDACMVIIWYSFRLYRPEDRVEIDIVHVPPPTQGSEASASSKPKSAAPMRAIIEENRGDVLAMMRHLINFIAYNLGRLSHNDELNTGEANLINEAFIQLSQQMDSTQVSVFARSPRIFKQHLFWVMALFLLLWVPFQLWITIGWTLTVIFYPIVMYLLSGPFIYRSFLGESFDVDSKAGLMDHDAQRRDAVNNIRNLFDPQRSSLRYATLLFSFSSSSSPPLSSSHHYTGEIPEPDEPAPPFGSTAPSMTMPTLSAAMGQHTSYIQFNSNN
jgi:hypothetical protein